MRGVAWIAVTGQQRRHAAAFAPAHRVGLAGEREGPRPGATDLARREVQVDQRRVLRRAAAALVQAHAVQRQRRRRLREPLRRLQDLRFLEAGEPRRFARRHRAHQRLQFREAGGVPLDEVRIDPALPDRRVQHAVEQRDVAARLDREVQVGELGRLGAARVHHDDLHLRPRRAGGLDAAEQDGMRPRGVGAGDEQTVGPLQILVAGGRRVGAQRLLVADHRRAHAQPRVAVDVVGADQAARQLVERVVVLGQQLARDVEADGIRPMLGADRQQLLGDAARGRVPVLRLERIVARGPPGRLQQALLLAHQRRRGQVQRRALGAQPAEVGRMVGITAHADDARGIALARRVDQHAAADPAVRAGRARAAHALGRRVRGRGGLAILGHPGVHRPVPFSRPRGCRDRP